MAAASAPPPSPSLLSLPADVQTHLLAFCDVTTLARFSEASSGAKQVTNEPRVWEALYLHEYATFGNPTLVSLVDSNLAELAPRLGAAAPLLAPAASPSFAPTASTTLAAATASITAAVDALRGAPPRHRYVEGNPLPPGFNARAAFKAQAARHAAEVRRNQTAQRLRRAEHGARERGRCLRGGLDCLNLVAVQACAFPCLLAFLVLLTGQVQGSWTLNWWLVFAPLLAQATLMGAAFAVNSGVEGATLDAMEDSGSAWYLQGHASRFSLCGRLAFMLRKALLTHSDTSTVGRVRAGAMGCVGSAAWCLGTVQLLTIAGKLALGEGGYSWGVAFIPTFLLACCWCVAPFSCASEYDTEEAAFASAACFCCVSIPTILMLALVAAKYDAGGDSDITLGGALSPLYFFVCFFLCIFCMASAALLHEGELGGNAAAQYAFTCLCCFVLSVFGAVLAFLVLMTQVDEGEVRAAHVAYGEPASRLANVTVPGGFINETTVHFTVYEEGDVSWWLLMAPLLWLATYCSGAVLLGTCAGFLMQRKESPLYYRPRNVDLPDEITEYV